MVLTTVKLKLKTHISFEIKPTWKIGIREIDLKFEGHHPKKTIFET